MNWESECERWHQTAMKKLKHAGRCPFRLRMYVKTGCELDWSDPDGLTDEGRVRLRMLSELFRSVSPIAVLISSDSWQAGGAFFKHYGLEGLPTEEAQRRYSEILEKEYRGTLAEVPDALKTEAVFTVVKGPQVVTAHRFTFYRREACRTGGDKIMVVEGESPGYMVTNLIPDWWEVTVQ
jgi:hypothetical protein